MLLFRTRYPAAHNCVLWHNAMLYVANDCFLTAPEPTHDPNDAAKGTQRHSAAAMNRESKRIWFLACIDGYKALAAHFSFIHGILQGLLHIGIARGLITVAEGRAHIDGAIQGSRRPSRLPAEYVQPGWMVSPSSVDGAAQAAHGPHHFILDLHGAMVDPVAASVEALSASFAKVLMLDQDGASEQDKEEL